MAREPFPLPLLLPLLFPPPRQCHRQHVLNIVFGLVDMFPEPVDNIPEPAWLVKFTNQEETRFAQVDQVQTLVAANKGK